MNVPARPYYDSANRLPLPLEELSGVMRFRELILELVRRDLITRYKRSFLGVIWTMLNPLAMMLVMALAFSHFFAGPRYAAHLLSGIVAWTFFAQASTAAVAALIWIGPVSRSIYLPRSLFAVSALCTGIVNFVLSLIPLAAVLLASGVRFRPAALFVPIPMLLLACFTLGIALLVSSLAIRFPDIFEVYPIILSGWIYLVPIIYPAEALPLQIQRLFWWLNPMYSLLGVFRKPILEGSIPPSADLAWCCLTSVLTLVAGWYLYGRQVDAYALQG